MSPKGVKRCCQIAPLDILCRLPKNLIDDILMRLPLRDAVRTSILSKEWRQLTLQHCLILPPPGFKGFDQLISLKLLHVTISSKSLESLISHCLLLEQLVLDISGLSGVIEINSPMLRSFDFVGKISSIHLKYIPLLAEFSVVNLECDEETRKCDIAKYFESFTALEHLKLDSDSLMGMIDPEDDPSNCLGLLVLSLPPVLH
ncbi:uncharacterized protein [Nicotiana tomentosiformis]|uniref:uncharacterized protein n=1 Tax=Nicotiana tomentosiformis TaxID=4098 RepID=UPI00388CA91D